MRQHLWEQLQGWEVQENSGRQLPIANLQVAGVPVRAYWFYSQEDRVKDERH